MGKRGLAPLFALYASVAILAAAGPPPPTQGEAHRTITVKILTDPAFRVDPSWKIKAESCLQAAAAEIERIAALKFEVVAHEEWTPSDSEAVETLAGDLDNRHPKERADILLAILGAERSGQTYYGYALFKEAIVVLTYPPAAPPPFRTLRHELGHLFGAVHVQAANSVMNYFVPVTRFDEPNAKAVALGARRSFNRVEPVYPRDVRLELADLYEEIIRTMGNASAMPLPGIKALVDESGRRDLSFLDDVYVALAQIRLDEKEYGRALETCEEALKLNPDNRDTRNLVGIALRRMGRVDEAIVAYREILDETPEAPRILYNLGIALAKDGDLASARAAYERALSLKPNFAEARNNLGDVFLRLGDREAGEREFRAALAIQADFPSALCNLAEALFLRKDFAQAEELAAKAAALDPALPDPWNVVGNIRQHQGRADEALAAYDKALLIDQRHEKVHYNLGICLFELGRIEDAEAHFVTALGIRPRFAEAHAGFGYCLIKTKRLDEGIREIEEALRLGFPSAKAHFNLSAAFVQKGDLGKAVGQARLAVERDPAFKEAWIHLGGLLLHDGKSNEALGPFLKAADLDPRDGPVANNISVCYFRSGDFAKSWEYALKAQALGVKIHPDFLAALKGKIEKRRPER
jgi:Flp pilus assembly protein TadD